MILDSAAPAAVHAPNTSPMAIAMKWRCRLMGRNLSRHSCSARQPSRGESGDRRSPNGINVVKRDSEPQHRLQIRSATSLHGKFIAQRTHCCRFAPRSDYYIRRNRPAWPKPSTVLRESSELTDTAEGWRCYSQYLALLAELHPQQTAHRFTELTKGWAVGSATFPSN